MKNPVDSIDKKKSYPDWQSYLDLQKDYCHLDGDGSDQLMVYRKNSDDAAFSKWIARLRAKLERKGLDSEVRIVGICGTCEHSLLLFTGKGIATFIKTEAAKKGTQQQRQTAVEGQNKVSY